MPTCQHASTRPSNVCTGPRRQCGGLGGQAATRGCAKKEFYSGCAPRRAPVENGSRTAQAQTRKAAYAPSWTETPNIESSERLFCLFVGWGEA
jgi:hypothetical protein